MFEEVISCKRLFKKEVFMSGWKGIKQEHQTSGLFLEWKFYGRKVIPGDWFFREEVFIEEFEDRGMVRLFHHLELNVSLFPPSFFEADA